MIIKNLHHLICNVHKLYLTFLVCTEAAIERYFSQYVFMIFVGQQITRDGKHLCWLILLLTLTSQCLARLSYYGLNSSRVFSSKVWNMAPTEFKKSATLNIFKEKIRKWEHKNCGCILSLLYIPLRTMDIKMLSEFNFSWFEKATPLITDFPATFECFLFFLWLV